MIFRKHLPLLNKCVYFTKGLAQYSNPWYPEEATLELTERNNDTYFKSQSKYTNKEQRARSFSAG